MSRDRARTWSADGPRMTTSIDPSSSGGVRARPSAAPAARESRRGVVLRAVVTALLALASAPVASAQTSAAPPAPTGTTPSTLPQGPFDGLALSETQRARIQKSTADTRAATQAILRRQRPPAPPPSADQRRLREIVDGHNAAVRAVLTPGQRERLDANMALLRAARLSAPAPESRP